MCQLARRHSSVITSADAPARECEERLLCQWQPSRTSTAPRDWLKIAPHRALSVPICNNRCVCCHRNKRNARLFSVSEVIYCCILIFKLTICPTFLRRDATAFSLIQRQNQVRRIRSFPSCHLPVHFPSVGVHCGICVVYNLSHHNACAYRCETTKRKVTTRMSSNNVQYG